MREIKFRVYCEFDFNGQLHKEMAEPSNWFLISQTGRLMTHEPTGGFNPNAEKDYTKLIPLFYTGLKDKNGKEVYEGDILRVPIDVYHVGVIKWCDKECRFFLDKPEMENYCWADLHDMSEVIGNIYENPELIGEVK